MYGNTDESITHIIKRLLVEGNFFGPTWSKIFRREIIEKYHIRFDERISYREDEVFTFEYCQYAKSIKVLGTTSYNYQVTNNSLMRKAYRTPQELMYVYNRSYQAALQLKLDDELRLWLERYYAGSLRYLILMLYFPYKLTKRDERLVYLDDIYAWNKKHPQCKCNKIIATPVITDYCNLVKYVLKCLMKGHG